MNTVDKNIKILEPKEQLTLLGFNDYFDFFKDAMLENDYTQGLDSCELHKH